MKYGLGIDTGGTYTDAVLLEMESGEVVSKAKSMTTHDELSLGIKSVLGSIDGSLLCDVGIVVLSSTLATNAVVENKGCRVGLVCVGDSYDLHVVPEFVIRVAGGHDINGDEIESLDVSAVRSFFESIKGKVDGIAVSSYMSVRNPVHEIRVRTLAREILNVPVVCGHELSSSLGFHERTTTCVMNCRLLPIVDRLIDSVKKVCKNQGINAPLMVLCGNGSIVSEEVAKERPVDTIMSGPVASLIGAMNMAEVADAIVMDIGGTTTDLGIIRNGRPSFEPEGATIGGHKTHVEAVNAITTGLGGDSRIIVDCGKVILLPERVIPLCVAAVRWPQVETHLRILFKLPKRRTMKHINLRYSVFDNEMFIAMVDSEGDCGLDDINRRYLELVRDAPCTLKGAALILGCKESDIDIYELISRGYLQRIGLTPTDILHAEGTYTEFDREASLIGVDYMAGLMGNSVDLFIDMAKRAIRNKLANEVMKAILLEDAGSDDLGPAGLQLVMRAITGYDGKDYRCFISLNKPIIGMGASSGVYIRWLGDVFDTDVLIPANSDVGNAIGAISASVSVSIDVLVRPELNKWSHDYLSFSKAWKFKCPTIEGAIEKSISMAKEFVETGAKRNYAYRTTVEVKCDRHEYVRIGDKTYDEAVIKVTAVGKPEFINDV